MRTMTRTDGRWTGRLGLVALAGLLLLACGDDEPTTPRFDVVTPGDDAGDDVPIDAADICPSAGVVISEFTATPASGEPEFVELIGPAGVSLNDFHLVGVNGAGGTEFTNVTLEGAFDDGGRFLVAASELAGANQLSDELELQNGPDNLVLQDCVGNVVDAVGYGNFSGDLVFQGEGEPAPSTSNGEALARCEGVADTDDNADDFHVVTLATPGEENANFEDPYACVPCVGGLFDDQVVISEVVYDPSGSDTIDAEFIELLATPGLDLFGLELELVNGNDGDVYNSLALDGVVGDDGIYVIGGPSPDQALPGTLQNGPDGVRLVDCEDSVVDALGYGDFGDDTPLGEGTPASAVSQGNALARCSDGADSDDNADDFYEASPTPGEANSGFLDVRACGGTGCETGLLDGRLWLSEVTPGTGGFVELGGEPGLGLVDVVVEILGADGTLLESHEFTASESVAGSGFAVISSESIPAAGGTVILYDCMGDELDKLAWGTGTDLQGEGTAADAPSAGQSLARCPDGVDSDNNAEDFFLTSTPTSGAENGGFVDAEACTPFVCESGLLTSVVLINEVLVNPSGTDGSNLTFIELRGQPDTVLEGSRLVRIHPDDGDEEGSVDLTGTIPASGFYLVGHDGRTPAQTTVQVDTEFVLDLRNTRGAIALEDCEGVLIDALAYGAVTADDLGEGTGFGEPDEGSSMSRCPDATLGDADSGDNATDFHLAEPSPGGHNVSFDTPGVCGVICVPDVLDGRVVINEVLPGTGGFIELFGEAEMDLTGAALEVLGADGSSVRTVDLDGGATNADGYYAETGIDDIPAAGGTVRLLDCLDEVVDAVAWGTGSDLRGEGTAADEPTGGQALGRCPQRDDTGDNATDFHLVASDGTTAGAQNSGFVDDLACASPLLGVVFINELSVDPTGDDENFLTFIELRGEAGTDITGLQLVARHRTSGDETDRLVLSGTIPDSGPSSGLFLVGQDPNDLDFAPNQSSDFAELTNSGAGVELVDADGAYIDSLAYGDVTADIGEPPLAPPTGANAGESLGRCPVALDSIDTDHNCPDFRINTTPSPGTENEACGAAPTCD